MAGVDSYGCGELCGGGGEGTPRNPPTPTTPPTPPTPTTPPTYRQSLPLIQSPGKISHPCSSNRLIVYSIGTVFVFIRAVDPDPHGKVFKIKTEYCKEVKNKCNFIQSFQVNLHMHNSIVFLLSSIFRFFVTTEN